jgi:protein dithiol oxidoreductase (disulfide-forming)
MRHALPTLICTLLLAACGSHSNSSESATTAPPAPATTATAPATTPAANTPAASATAPATPSQDTAATTADDAAADTGASGPSLTQAQRAEAEKIYQQGLGKWTEGKNYFDIDPNQPRVGTTSKVEVVEVFSWGCPACNQAHPFVDSMRKQLPSFATMVYLPASFIPTENWPMYQRTFFTAKAMGVARKSYDAMFDAVWKSGELATYNLAGRGLKDRADWPTIDDVAKFYAKKFGVDAKQFVAVAHSFSINTQMKRADELIKSYGVASTPNFVVNGMYRFDYRSAGGVKQTPELANWLAAKAALGK